MPERNPPSDEKKFAVQEAALQKMALLGTKAEQRRIATAELQGNTLADAPEIQDIRGLNPVEFAAKYGHAAERLRAGYSREVMNLQNLRNAERAPGDVIKDSAIDTGKMVVNTLGGAGILGANVVDAALGTTIAPLASQGLETVNEFANEQQSQLMQDRRQQMAVGAELDAEDRAIRQEARLTENADAESAWDRTVKPTLQNFTEGFTDTVENYVEDPIMLGSLVPEGVGSLLPATAGIKVLGKANALRTLARQGIKGEAAETFLKTQAGRELLDTASLKAAPLVMGVTETGGAVHQSQLDILAQDDETLAASPQFQELVAGGSSPEEARMQLAREAGTIAGLAAAPGAVVAGKISAPFASAPLRVAGNKPLVAASSNVASEAVEETLQEANSQIATNLGARGVGLERDLDEGVGEAAAGGFLGGIATSGAMQAPGTIAGTTIDVTKAAGKAAGAGIQKGLEIREGQAEAAADATSDTGTPAREAAAARLNEAATAMSAQLAPELSTEETEAAAPAEAAVSEEGSKKTQINSTIQGGLYADQGTMELMGQLGLDVSQPLPRSAVIEAASEVMQSNEDIGIQTMMAVTVMKQMIEMRKMDSDEVADYIQSLPEDSPMRASFQSMQENLPVLEASPGIEFAQNVLGSLTPEILGGMVQMDVLQDPEADPEVQEQVADIVEMVLTVNPSAFGSEEIFRVTPEGKSVIRPSTAAAMENAQETNRVFDQIMSEKEAIEEAVPGYSTTDTVSEEIRSKGNQNNKLPSLEAHRTMISLAAQAGRTKEATALLEDLSAFAGTLANKVGALNDSAEGKSTRPDGRVGYQARSQFGLFFKEDADGVFVNLKSLPSMAMAHEVRADAVAAASIAASLAKQYGLAVTPIDVPALSSKIVLTPKAVVDNGPEAAKEAAKPAVKPEPKKTPARKPKTRTRPKVRTPKKAVSPETLKKLNALVTARREALELAALKTRYRKVHAERNKAEKALKKAEPQTDEYAALEGDWTQLEMQLAELADQITDRGGEVPYAKGAQAPEPAPAAEVVIQETTPREAPIEAATEPTPEVTPEVTEGDVVEEVAAKTWLESLKDVLPKSVKGVQNFLVSFKPGKSGSKILTEREPIAWLRSNLDRGSYTAEQVTSMGKILDERFPTFQEGLEAKIQEFLEGKDLAKAMTWTNALPLNLWIPDDGTVPAHLEPKVMAAAFIATYEWMAQNARKPRKMDDDDINKMFGRPRGTTLDEGMREAAQTGVSLQQAQEQIANSMMTLLDISPKKDADIKMTQGIMKSLAANSLELLMDDHVKRVVKKGQPYVDGNEITTERDIAWRYTQFTKDGKNQQMITLLPREEFVADEDFQALVQLRAPFTETATEKRVRARLIGEGSALTRVAPTKLGNALAPLSKQEAQVVERLQNTPAFVNSPMVDLVRKLGPDLYRKLMGHVEITDQNRSDYSPDHLLSIEGRNQTIEHDLGETLQYIAETERAAGTPDKVSSVPIFFEWAVSSVGRLQQLGPVTPQGSKIAREMISSTNSTLDLVGENKDLHEWAMWAAVGQALGVKIEKFAAEDREVNGEMVLGIPSLTKAKVAKEHGAAVAALESLLRGEDVPREELFKALSSVDNDKGVHALLTLARYNVAVANGDTTFTTALALEADGKTDGPVNAMIHMGTDNFRPNEIELFAKGGLFFSDRPISLAEYIAIEDKNGADIYLLASKLFERSLSGRIQDQATAAGGRVAAVHGLLNAFLPDFTITKQDDGSFLTDVGRNVIKNPLTVFLYGSGDKGIAGKVASQVQEEIGKFLTDLISNGKKGIRISEHKKLVENPQLLEDMADILFQGDQTKLIAWLRNASESSIAPWQYENMRTQILESFVEPMIEAIDETTGGLQEKMKFMQAVASAHTAVFQHAFKTALDKAQAAKKEAGEQLSEQEVLDLFAETMKLAPIYANDAQSFQISAPQRNADLAKTIASTFSDKLPSKATYVDPSDASVKVSPYLTIGNGDGRMIQNIYLNGDGSFDVSLPVFDGVEMSLDTIGSASGQINEQTFQTWMQANPYRDVQEGFSQMLSQLSPELVGSLPPAAAAQIQRSGKLLGMQGNVGEILRAMDDRLKADAMSREARTLAMKAVGVTSDHMAGAQVPSFQAGRTIEGGDPTDFSAIAGLLNQVYQEELAKLGAQSQVPERQFEKKSLQPVSKKLLEVVETLQIGDEEAQTEPGVTKVSAAALVKAILVQGKDMGFTPEQLGLLEEMSKTDRMPSNLNMLFGDAEAFQTQNMKGRAGRYDGGANEIYIVQASPETVLHELIHAYLDPILSSNNESPEVTYALDQLKKLMGDVRSLNTYDLDKGDAAALRSLQDVLNKKQDDPVAQMHEMIAYTLSSPSLIAQTKRTKVYNALTEIVRNALRWIRKIPGFGKVKPGENLYSNIRFNTRILLAQDPVLADAKAVVRTNLVLDQVYGEDARLSQIESSYMDRLKAVIEGAMASLPAGANQETVDKVRKAAKERSIGMIAEARRTVQAVQMAGWDMNDREATVFEAVHAAMSSKLAKGQPVMRQVREAFTHVNRTATIEDVLTAMGIEEGTANEATKAQAQSMLDFISGASGLRAGADGQSDVIPTFMALAQTSPEFRTLLENMAPPKVIALQWDSVDAWVSSLVQAVVNLITRASLQPRKMAPNMRLELDALSGTLSEIQAERHGMAAAARASAQLNEFMEKANAFTASKLEEGSAKLTDKLDALGERAGNQYVKDSFFTAARIVSLGSETRSEATGDTLTRMLNDSKGMETMRSLLSEFRGITKTNAPLWRLINPVKAQIDGVRQDSREGVPKHLATEFSRQLTNEEWTGLHRGWAQTDMLALGHEETLALTRDPTKAGREIAKAEEQVGKLGGQFANRYRTKAKTLARYMVTNEVTSENLLANAHAIAHLFGEQGGRGRQLTAQATPELIKAIDNLTSLYAFDLLDQETKDSMKNLMETEENGMQAVSGMLKVIRQAELERRDRHGTTNPTARNNGLKGFVPVTPREGHQVQVFPSEKHAELVRKGWVKIGTFRGDSSEGRREPRAYYQTTVGGKGAFRQGVAQTVNDTWQGVDARTGQSLTGKTAGVFLGSRAMAVAQTRDKAPAGSLDGLAPGEYLMPIFDGGGEVTGYQRAMAAEKLSLVPVDDHLGRMLGVWMGRILEENLSDATNSTLVQTMKEIYDEGKTRGELSGFVNIADPKNPDPVIRDAWNTLGWRIKAEIEREFGPKTFWVRKDMVDDTIGFRAATITDAWSGVTRWSPETQEKIMKAATLVLGKDAFKVLRTGDRALREGVSWAKETIIIRSGIVMVGNELSNKLHLMIRGVPITKIISGSRDKFVEITEYVANKEEIQRLQVKMASVISNPKMVSRYKAEIQVLEEANDNMSIAPLIEAGEFSTIAEGLDEADVAFREGSMSSYIEKQVNKLPDWSKTTLKNVAITKDTAVYKGLNRAVQYSDFISKAILYDHLMEQGRDQREVLDVIFEEFVPYNRLAGRTRDAIEGMGLAWFLNYKLRIMKVLATTMRERPLHALGLFSGGESLTGIQTIWDGSLIGAWQDGRLGYSLGMGMGLNSPFLHPVGTFLD